MKKKILHVAIGLLGIYAQQAYACIIGLTNDSNKPLMVITDDFKEGMMLPAGGFVEFGSKKYMANFRVMQQNGKNFTQQYHLQQTACTPGKYTKLKISEITNNPNIPFNVSIATPKQIANLDTPAKSSCGCEH